MIAKSFFINTPVFISCTQSCNHTSASRSPALLYSCHHVNTKSSILHNQGEGRIVGRTGLGWCSRWCDERRAAIKIARVKERLYMNGWLKSQGNLMRGKIMNESTSHYLTSPTVQGSAMRPPFTWTLESNDLCGSSVEIWVKGSHFRSSTNSLEFM